MQQATPMTDDDATTIEHPAVDELPPSAKLVYYALRDHGPSTQQELLQATALARQTLRYALDQLQEADAVTSELKYNDARQRLYRPTNPG